MKVAEKEQASQEKPHGCYLGNLLGDLAGPLKYGMVDVLIFNPPYVPTPDLPSIPDATEDRGRPSYEDDSHLLSLSYAGGADGMETTDRLLNDIPKILSKTEDVHISCSAPRTDRSK